MSQLAHSALSVAAYAEGVAQWRSMMKWLGLAGAIVLIAGTALIDSSADHNAVDFYILATTGCVYLLCTMLVTFVHDKKLYVILLAWVMSATLAGVGLSLNAMFGEHADALLEGKMPFMTPVVPAIIVFAHSYLAPSHALKVTIGSTGLMSIACVIYLAVHWQLASHSLAAIFFMVTHMVLNPTVIGLMTVHHGTLRSAILRYEQLVLRNEREHSLQARMENSDPETQFLNVAGLKIWLEDYFSESNAEELAKTPNGVLTLAIEPTRLEKLSAISAAEQELLVGRISRCLRETLGDCADFARIDRWGYLAIATDGNEAWDRDRLSRLQSGLNALLQDRKGGAKFHLGVGIASPGEDVSFVLEEVNFQRYLAETRDVPWVVSPMVPESLALRF